MHKVLALAAVLSALGSPAAAATTWLCHLSDDLVRLACVADPASAAEADVAAVPAAATVAGAGAGAVTAVVHGTRFPLDAERLWVVDLWSPPTDWAFVEQLARATICYRSPGCKVMVAPLRR